MSESVYRLQPRSWPDAQTSSLGGRRRSRRRARRSSAGSGWAAAASSTGSRRPATRSASTPTCRGSSSTTASWGWASRKDQVTKELREMLLVVVLAFIGLLQVVKVGWTWVGFLVLATAVVVGIVGMRLRSRLREV